MHGRRLWNCVRCQCGFCRCDACKSHHNARNCWSYSHALVAFALVLVKVICRSMGYTHGSISISPCGFYGCSDLCAAAGSPVVCDLRVGLYRLGIERPVHVSGRVRLNIRWFRMDCRRIFMESVGLRLHGSCFRCCRVSCIAPSQTHQVFRRVRCG